LSAAESWTVSTPMLEATLTPRDTSSNRRPEGLDCLELGSSPGNRMSSFVGAAGRRPLFWCLMAAIFASPPADAQTPARIGGSTEDSTGAPISGMTITLKGAAERVTLSGPDGRFAFENLPAGEYELRGVAAGFAAIVRRLRLAECENVDVELRPWVLVLDSVTVTAPRTGQRDVQATPLAVTVLSGTELQRVQSPSVEDVSGRAPAVTFSDIVGLGTLTIRGIGTNAVFAGSDPSSAVYVDGVYLARPVMALVDLFDTERIEVLRGPQGTLYGRNAVGGALHVITKLPTSELEASARLVAGDGGMLRADARVSGPLVPGRVMGSAAFLRGLREGFVQDLDHPGHPLGGEDVAAARVKLLVVLARRSQLLLSGDMTHRDPPPLNAAKVLSVKPGYEVDNPQPQHEVRTSTLAESRNRQYGAAARLTLRLSPGTTLTSLTAFRKVDFDLLVDSDITELRLAETRLHEIQHQWSEEVTASGGAPRLRWVGGVFVLEDVDREPFSIRLEAPGLETRFDAAVHATSGAAFVQATLAIARQLSLTAGLRYTRERKTIDNFGSLDTLDVPPVVVPGSGYAYSDSISHGAWTPKLALELRRGERLLGYASATRGFKSGGFNFTSREPGRGYDPEWAWSYEAGLKTRAAGGRVRFGFAAFHTDYSRHHPRLRGGGRRRALGRASGGWTRGVAGRHLRPVPRRAPGRRAAAGGRAPAQQRACLVGASVVRVEEASRPREDALASRRFEVAENGLLHALQRLRRAAESLRPAGRERRIWVEALVRGCLCAEPDQRGLHHGDIQFSSAGDRGPPRGAAAGRRPADAQALARFG
jgi:outer membrane receptor protein involved in Fe transport